MVQPYSAPTITELPSGAYLALALPLQVHHTHVHDGSQVGEGLHDAHVRALVVAVHVELETQGGIRAAAQGQRISTSEDSSPLCDPIELALRGSSPNP